MHEEYFDAPEGEIPAGQKMTDMYHEIDEAHQKIVRGINKRVQDGEELPQINSYIDDIEESRDSFYKELEELRTYYNEVFTTTNDKKSLRTELEDRIEQLKEIEYEAKKVVGLSSDAGLAGGFVVRGKSARLDKQANRILFYLSLFILILFNGYILITTPDLADNIEDLLIKSIFGLPAIWMAIVSNSNMNKYSILEEEYAHKESLAKSFERYKTEIEKLEDSESQKSKELLFGLMETNIEAFKVNPAETMLNSIDNTQHNN
jgi:hypothetical protein